MPCGLQTRAAAEGLLVDGRRAEAGRKAEQRTVSRSVVISLWFGKAISWTCSQVVQTRIGEPNGVRSSAVVRRYPVTILGSRFGREVRGAARCRRGLRAAPAPSAVAGRVPAMAALKTVTNRLLSSIDQLRLTVLDTKKPWALVSR